jgi:hypothetical protein
MKRLKFSIEPNINIKKLKKIILKFKKNKNYNKKNVKWDYFANPFGKSKFFVAKYDNLILGMLVCYKQIYINKSKKFKGYRIQDVITNIELIKKLIKKGKSLATKNKKGIFDNLILKLNHYTYKNSNINLGFANQLAFPFWIRNDWQDLSPFPVFEKRLNKIEKFSLEFNIIKKFSVIHEKFFLTNLNNKINVFWNAKYLNWRYIKNPRSKYFSYEFFLKEKLIGYVVMKEYLSDKEKMGHICLLIANTKYKEEIIKFTNNFFLKRKIYKLSLWSFDHNLMKRIGFKKEFSNKKNIVYSGKLNLKKQNFDINMGFSDIY